MQLICTFVFAYARSRFSHDAAHVNSVIFNFVMLGVSLYNWGVKNVKSKFHLL